MSAVGAPAGIAAWSEQADAGPSGMPQGNPESTAVGGDKNESVAVPEPSTFFPAAVLVAGALLRRRRGRGPRSGGELA